VDILRTPEERFADLPDYPFDPRYADIGDGLRMHYVDEGPPAAPVVLMLHGEPSWSFLYRHMIPPIAAAGFRAVAPDLVGFGKSDKPAAQSDYTYDGHLAWLWSFVEGLELNDITLVCQDWGGLLGLRLVAEHPDRFARVIAANTFLPTGREPLGDAFAAWRTFATTSPAFDIGTVVSKGCATELSPAVIASYDAPFPDESYKAGARVFPALVPDDPGKPDALANQKAWASLSRFDRPFLTAFSDKDPITRGADKFLRAAIAGAKDQPHTTIEGGGHFLQEDRGPELAEVVIDFVRAS